ncbi:hypothetical protein P792_13955 [Asaia sp. SF2.1]|nr:hypothetical protein P792_13955 [Asaia sp. SF2.1]
MVTFDLASDNYFSPKADITGKAIKRHVWYLNAIKEGED